MLGVQGLNTKRFAAREPRKVETMPGKTVINLIVTAALLFAVFRSVDISQARFQTSAFWAWPWVGAFSLLVVQHFAFRALRWNLILSFLDKPFSYSKAWQFAAVSQFFNQILPSSVGGDGVLIYLAHKEERSLRVAVHSVLIDRIVGTSTLLSLCIVTLPFAAAHLSDRRMLAAVSLSLAALAASLSLPLILRMAAKISPARFASTLQQFCASIGSVWRPWSRLCALMVICGAGHIFMAASVCLIAVAFAIPLPIFPTLLFLPSVFLLTIVPVSFGGWGLREASMVVLLGYGGVSPADALTVSVLFGLTDLAVSMPGGIVWLIQRSGDPLLRASDIPK